MVVVENGTVQAESEEELEALSATLPAGWVNTETGQAMGC